MATQFILTDYIHDLMAQAEYDALEDGTFGGRIPGCKGVVAFANSLCACEAELHATLEDWIFVGIKLGFANSDLMALIQGHVTNS